MTIVKAIEVVNATTGIPFVVTLSEEKPHGDDGDARPVVCFYDGRYKRPAEVADRPFTPYGQFVSRYLLDTLIEDNRLAQSGLNLYGGVAEWCIDASTMEAIIAWLKAVDPRKVGA